MNRRIALWFIACGLALMAKLAAAGLEPALLDAAATQLLAQGSPSGDHRGVPSTPVQVSLGVDAETNTDSASTFPDSFHHPSWHPPRIFLRDWCIGPLGDVTKAHLGHPEARAPPAV